MGEGAAGHDLAATGGAARPAGRVLPYRNIAHRSVMSKCNATVPVTQRRATALKSGATGKRVGRVDRVPGGDRLGEPITDFLEACA